MYSCGANLFAEVHPLSGIMIIWTTSTCELPVEATYYGATTITGASFVNDDNFKQLKEQYTQVRSYCLLCKSLGKEPMTLGAMTASAKKKQKLSS